MGWSPTASSTRYDPEASLDGLQGVEGTFSLCTFAYVDALARHDEGLLGSTGHCLRFGSLPGNTRTQAARADPER